MSSPEDLRVHGVARLGDLLLNRVEREVDRQRSGVTAIRLQLVNRGDHQVTVERVVFHREELTVALPINRPLDPGRYLVVVGPETADEVTLRASVQGKSADFKPGVVFQMTLHVTGAQGAITLTQPITWGFWMEGGYGFTLPPGP